MCLMSVTLVSFSATIIKYGVILAASYMTSIAIHKVIECCDLGKVEANEFRILTREVTYCQEHIVHNIVCGLNCANAHINWIIGNVMRGVKTIDVCMYLLSYEEIVGALIEASNRGVLVRLITTPDKEDTGTMVLKIRRAGINVRSMVGPQSELMHLKFILVDEKVVIFGSMNFTVSGFTGNTEELLRTTNHHLVTTCSSYFCALWEAFDDQDDFLNNMARLKNQRKKNVRFL